MSPRPAAPSSASQIACSSTSASEWPSSPLAWAISTPPMTSLRPSANGCTSKPWPILISLASLEDGLGDGEVLGPGHLEVLAAAGDDPRLEPHLLHRARLVGHRTLRPAQRLREQPG